MRSDRQRHGMTMLELMVVLAIIGALIGVATAVFRSWNADQRVKGAARDVGDLLIRGRAEAIRTGTPHMVFIGFDDAMNPLTWNGKPVAALLIADLDGDAQIDPGEDIDHVDIVPGGLVGYGRSLAGVTLAPGDPFKGTALEGSVLEQNTPGNFQHPTNPNLIEPWVLFRPDGTPRAAINNGGGGTTLGTVGSGSGAVYITNARDLTRDYAVVMAPLGGIQVLRWDPTAAAWR
jgi:prepilin-type N-terminal cleavage/methylation domain-containing protein